MRRLALICRVAGALAAAGALVFLSGCWTAPSATVRPHGKPGVIAGGIAVEGVVDSATVESVDRAARTLLLSVHGVPLPACKVGQGVRNWDEVHPGDQVRATIKDVLTLYIGANQSPHARVLLVDPSYRLLTVQYPGGGTETFKLGLHTPMKEIAAGDTVAIRPIEAVDLHVRRHSNREQDPRSGQRATPSG